MNQFAKPLDNFPQDLNFLNIIYKDDLDKNNFILNDKYELEKKIEDLKISKYALTLNEKNLFKNNGYNKGFKLLNNKKINKILKHKFDHIIFSDCHEFLNHNNTYRNGLKKN